MWNSNYISVVAIYWICIVVCHYSCLIIRIHDLKMSHDNSWYKVLYNDIYCWYKSQIKIWSSKFLAIWDHCDHYFGTTKPSLYILIKFFDAVICNQWCNDTSNHNLSLATKFEVKALVIKKNDERFNVKINSRDSEQNIK